MISIRFSRTVLGGLLGGVALCIAFSYLAAAQVKSQTSTEEGQATKEVVVERGEIVYINGNTVVVRMEDGTMHHFDNIPDTVSFMVDGKPVNIHNAKVGMKLQKETVKTTTPRVVTTVETVTGKVWHVSPPNWVILTLENGKNQRFNIPKNQMFTVDGKETDAFGLKKGMIVNAQKVIEVPETVAALEYKRTGKMPPTPPEIKADVPILVVVVPNTAPPAPVEMAAETTPSRLPKTASNLPLVGLLGALFCSLSLTAMTIRTIASRPTCAGRTKLDGQMSHGG